MSDDPMPKGMGEGECYCTEDGYCHHHAPDVSDEPDTLTLIAQPRRHPPTDTAKLERALRTLERKR